MWDALGAGYGRQEDGSSRITFSLLYSDPDAAGVDEGELLSRMKDYRMETYGTSPDEPVLPFILFCDSLASRTQVHDAGSTLSITCDSAKAPSFWALLVDDRDLGFLLP